MKVILYINESEANKLNKKITNPEELEGTFKNDSSVIYSNIAVQRTNPNSLIRPMLFIQHENPTKYNYVYIPEFKRYYFVNDIKNIRNNLWEFNLSVDVLMSYKHGINNMTVIIDKQEFETQANRYFDDGTYVTENKTFIESIPFETG